MRKMLGGVPMQDTRNHTFSPLLNLKSYLEYLGEEVDWVHLPVVSGDFEMGRHR